MLALLSLNAIPFYKTSRHHPRAASLDCYGTLGHYTISHACLFTKGVCVVVAGREGERKSAVDSEKAFDNLNGDFMVLMMEKMEMGQEFLNAIKINMQHLSRSTCNIDYQL